MSRICATARPICGFQLRRKSIHAGCGSAGRCRLRPAEAAGGSSSSGQDADDGAPPPTTTKLASIIKRKQQELQQLLNELGEEGLETRLQSAAERPPPQSHRLAALLEQTIPQGRPVLVLEACRSEAITSPQQLGELAARLAQAGADAISVRTDAEDTPSGLADLFAVCRAVPHVPVLQRDWFIHPLQVAGAKEAGAAGVLGVVASVSSRGTPLMSSFAASLGLDCPVEVVNMQELRAMERFSVPFFAVNLSVGLSVRLQGFGEDVARGLLGELPFGAVSILGAKSIEEAGRARLAGADALLVRRELVVKYEGREGELLAALRQATDGDD